MKNLRGKMRSAHRVIDEALEVHNVGHIWALFSGGHDSMTSTHVTSLHPAFRGVVHIDTGTGIPETQQYVKAMCERHGWELIIKTPATVRYENLIQNYGFPGQSQHTSMYRYLKERPLDQARIFIQKRGDKIAWASGARSAESVRRMGHVQTSRKDGHGIWINPIHDWTHTDCDDYMRAMNLPKNPVKAQLGMSGECLCGAYASPEEAKLISLLYPVVGYRIKLWEKLAEQARETQQWEHKNGFRDKPAMPKKYCKWGHGRRVSDDQLALPGMELQALCTHCNSHAMDRQMLAVKKLKEIA